MWAVGRRRGGLGHGLAHCSDGVDVCDMVILVLLVPMFLYLVLLVSVFVLAVAILALVIPVLIY